MPIGFEIQIIGLDFFDFLAGLFVGVGGHDDDFETSLNCLVGAHLTAEFKAVHFGHAQVEEDNAGVPGSRQ